MQLQLFTKQLKSILISKNPSDLVGRRVFFYLIDINYLCYKPGKIPLNKLSMYTIPNAESPAMKPPIVQA